MTKSISSTLYLTFSLATFSCLIPYTAEAQVTADGTTATTVNQVGDSYTIEQGDRIGDNLFHSFDEFSVPTLGSAIFNNANDVANIFSRVTGSNISNIDGLLGANGTANFYLINPNGIIFGENARLDLGGSFFVSTTDSLLFEDNTEFSASNPQAPPLLEVNIPIGLSFRDNPGDIVNQSIVQNSAGDVVGLEVTSGKNITLVGGTISFDDGNITASSGNIELGGLSEAGTVGINDDGSLGFPENVVQANINLSNAADVDVRGTGGGSITINARNLNLEAGDSSSSFIRSGITANSTSAEAQAGDITINSAENITVDESSISNRVDEQALGNAGNITIKTGSLSLTNGGVITASTFGKGDSGTVEITASDTVTFDGEASDKTESGVFSQVGSQGEGNSGGVTLTTSSLSLTNGGQISASTFGKGNSGVVEITASDTVTFDGESSDNTESGVYSRVGGNAEGDSGGVTITTGSLSLKNGAQISASTFGQGDSGAVEITASDTVTFDGESSDTEESGVYSQVGGNAEGKSGGVTVKTGSLSLINGGQIIASTSGKGDSGAVVIDANDTVTFDGEGSNGRNNSKSGVYGGVGRQGEGDSGGVTVKTGSFFLKNGGFIRVSTFGQGNSGAVVIDASDIIHFDGEGSTDRDPQSGIFSRVESNAEGHSGGVTITTSSLSLTNGGAITASTNGEGNSGEVNIIASNTITIDGETSKLEESGVYSQVNSTAEGNSGGITITTGSLSLTNGGQITASTSGQGDSGEVKIIASDTVTFDGEGSRESDNSKSGVYSSVGSLGEGDSRGVTITTGSLSLTDGGQITASTSGQGNAGGITIDSRESIFISGGTESNRSGLSANALISNGTSGNINVLADRIIIDEGGTIEAGNVDRFELNAPGTGQPGNINIEANTLSLSNEARIDAVTQADTGNNANIDLQITEDIILRDNSFISVEALNEANGGNLDIDVEFIIAFPNQNNDIIAKANQGSGGEISITAQSLFGIQERPLNPSTNDIDASSDFGTQGITFIITPNIDPASGLIELPEAVGDASDQVSQNPCEQGVGSEFTVTGKGGLPSNPNETLNSNRIRVGLVDPVLSRQEEELNSGANNISPEKLKPAVVPAQGWIFNDQGEVMLTSFKTTDTEIERTPQKIPNSCSVH